MSSKHLLLFLVDIANLLLESEVLFPHIVIFQSGLHLIDVFLYFSLVDFVHPRLNLLSLIPVPVVNAPITVASQN